MKKKYIVSLSEKERIGLERIVKNGENKAYLITHAHILLKANVNGPALSDQEIAAMFHCHSQTVNNVRVRYSQCGLEAALKRKTRNSPPIKPILDGEKEARLIALSCQQPPEGYSKWTCKLLSERLVQLEIVESISRKTVERVLKKRTQTPPPDMLGNSTRSKR
jgi:transposase